MATKKDLIIVENNYPMLASKSGDVLEAMKANLDGEAITARELFKQVPSPSGGDEFWTIDTPNGKQTYESLTGIILSIGNERALFEGAYGEGSDIPVCVSKNGVEGEGEPGGLCSRCSFQEWGEDKSPPECTQKKPIFMLVPEINPVLPIVITTTATSFPVLKKYRVSLTQYGFQPHFCEVKISLKESKTQNGRPSSLLQFETISNIREQAPETFKKIEAFRETFLPYMNPDYIVEIVE